MNGVRRLVAAVLSLLSPLFFRRPRRVDSWISAADERLMADNSLQKTAKTARTLIRKGPVREALQKPAAMIVV
jgi:hypothetical protein